MHAHNGFMWDYMVLFHELVWYMFLVECGNVSRS